MHFFFIFHWLSLPPRVDTGRSLHLLRCCFVSLNKVIIMRLDLLKALLADIVLHLAGILQCDLRRNSKSLQHLGKYGVSLIDLVGDLCGRRTACGCGSNPPLFRRSSRAGRAVP